MWESKRVTCGGSVSDQKCVSFVTFGSGYSTVHFHLSTQIRFTRKTTEGYALRKSGYTFAEYDD